MITENLSTLKIHKLTQAQYDRELENGNIDETALYLTPEEDFVTIDKGGTNATSLEEAQQNLEIAPAIEDAEHAGCYYRMVNGEKEWINPPMELCVEYKTVERYKGYNVYVYAHEININNDTDVLSVAAIPCGVMEIKEFISMDGTYLKDGQNGNIGDGTFKVNLEFVVTDAATGMGEYDFWVSCDSKKTATIKIICKYIKIAV